MKEDFLHYVWKHQKVSAPLITEQGYLISVFKPGSHNKHGGPDFEFAELILNDLRWVGAVEIHLRSSDWYRHGHHNDPAYDAVILHVVWEDDVEVCRNDGTLMHTLTLKKVVPTALVDRYQFTFKRAIEFIPCEHEIKQVEATHWVLWKERLYIERLEERSKRIHQLYAATSSVFSLILGKGDLQTKWMKNIGVSPFWTTHYTFNKTSKERSKKLTDAFVDLLIINTLIPYYFSHQRAHGKEVSEKILGWIRKIKLEKNSLVEKYRQLGIIAENALDSQALIHLNKSYCKPKKSLFCAVGNQLMKQE